MYNLSDICSYKKIDECRNNLHINYIEDNSKSKIDIKRINRDIKIDNLLNGADYELEEHTDSYNVKTLVLYATKFKSKNDVYDFIIDKIINTKNPTINISSNIKNDILRETYRMGVEDISRLVVLINPINSNLLDNYLDGINIVYNYKVPIDEVIINIIASEIQKGLYIFEGNCDNFYISDINFENTISKIKLKRAY